MHNARLHFYMSVNDQRLFLDFNNKYLLTVENDKQEKGRRKKTAALQRVVYLNKILRYYFYESHINIGKTTSESNEITLWNS